MLTVGSLFSGIGGIDLGLERAGMTVKWHSEIDPYACRVLKKHWPSVPNIGNIKEVKWDQVEPVDLIAGGYPCQPFSTAGKRQGEKDERHLWPYFLRAISELRPRFALLENVRGHLSMGFDRVLGNLAEIGYDAEWQIVSAASVGAPHRRDRIICVAYPNNAGSRTPQGDMGERGTETTQDWQGNSGTQHGISGQCEDVADANCCDSSNGRQCANVQSKGTSRGHDGSGSGSNTGQVSLGSPRQIADDVADAYGGRCQQCEPEAQQVQRAGCSCQSISNSDCKRNGGWVGGFQQSSIFGRLGSDNERGEDCYTGWKWWEVEPDLGRVAHGIPARVDRLRGLGNAVVPQVAEYVGRLIMASLT